MPKKKAEEKFEAEEPTEEKKPLSYEQLREAFQLKVNGIPEECHEALVVWRLFQHTQKLRMAIANKARQAEEIEGKVFWAKGIPDMFTNGLLILGQYRDTLQKDEQRLARRADKLMRATNWFQVVAKPAAENNGMGGILACELMWCIGKASRFSSFGKIVRYAGLHVWPNGKAPGRMRGFKIDYNIKLKRALFNLTEVWLKDSDGIWRARWDAYKAAEAEKHPDLTKGHIHNRSRRLVQREFLRNLYTLGVEYEKETLEEIEEPQSAKATA